MADADGKPRSKEPEQQHLGPLRDFVNAQCAKLAEQLLAQFAAVLGDVQRPGPTAAGGAQPLKLSLPPVPAPAASGNGGGGAATAAGNKGPAAGASAAAPADAAGAEKPSAQPPTELLATTLTPALTATQTKVLLRSDASGALVTLRSSLPSRPVPPRVGDNGAGEPDTAISAARSLVARWADSGPTEAMQARRILLFMDMSPECDDECAFLFLLSDLNHKAIEATIDLVMADSQVRFKWMEHLFQHKFTGSSDWVVREEGYGFQVGSVTVNFFVLHSAQREQVAIKEFKAKAPLLDLAAPSKIHGLPCNLVAEGVVDVVLLAAPVPDLDPKFFSRFTGVQVIFVVGTPGGINCPQPSWSGLLTSLSQLGPVLYLAPQFTRSVRFPRAYVKDNPHWTPYMRQTVLDMALTCMARRPEIPVAFGDWGLILRLNAANAKLCEAWFENVMCKPVGDVDSCPAYIKSVVQAYVDRNSGDDRKLGGIVNELRQLGVFTEADIDSHGQPINQEARLLIREDYRKELFKNVYICVATAETVLFQNEANFKPNTGAGHFRTLYPRCGYSDPLRSLSTIYGVEDAITIMRDLPIEALTPAYDMVGAMFTTRFLKRGTLDGLGLNILDAEASMSSALLTPGTVSTYPMLVIAEQPQPVVDTVVGMLKWEVEHDPLLVIDSFWTDWRDSVGKVGGSWHGAGAMRLERSRSRGSSVHGDVFKEIRAVKADQRRACQRLVVHPSSAWSAPWEAICVLCLAYDFVTVPLQAVAVNPIDELMELTTAVWTVDIVRSFFVGYYRQGSLELRVQYTVWHYLTTWFILDFLIVSSDWVLLLQEHVYGSGTEALRVLRALRLLRLLRLSRLPGVLRLITAPLSNPMVAAVVKVFNMLFFIFATTHLVACGWCFMAAPFWAPDGNSLTWITGNSMAEASTGLLYTTSMHWALSHLLLGETDIVPKTVVERCYSILAFLLGLVVFSCFVSSLTEFASQLAESTAEMKRQDDAVRRYFERNAVSVQLANQIQSFRKHTRQTSQKSVPRQDIEGLRIIPESLANKLSAEVYGPKLRVHGFFHVYAKQDEARLNRSAAILMSEHSYLPDAEVFWEAEESTHVLIVIDGELNYTQRGDTERICGGQWVSEPAMWLIWKRRGDLQSVTGAYVLQLSIKAFRDWAVTDVPCGLFAAKFAELLARSLLNLDTSIAEVSDLYMDKEALEVIADRATQLTGYHSAGTFSSSATMSTKPS